MKIFGHKNGVGCGIEFKDNNIITGGGDTIIKIWDLNIIDMQKDKFRQITNGNTPLEAAYSMVIWLLENGYIKTEK